MKDKVSDRINIVIDSELKKRFRIKCIENGTTISKVLKSFIKEYTGDISESLEDDIKGLIYNPFIK